MPSAVPKFTGDLELPFATTQLSVVDVSDDDVPTRESVVIVPPEAQLPIWRARAARWSLRRFVLAARVWLRDLVDPRSGDEVLLERRLIETCVAEYHGEIAWHMQGGEKSLFGAWKSASIDRWRVVAKLVRLRREGGAR